MAEQGAALDADLIRQKLKLYEMTLTLAVVDAARARPLGAHAHRRAGVRDGSCADPR